MQIVQICTFFFPVHVKSVVVPSFEGKNWPIFYKISIYVITCAKLHKYGLNGGWDLWCWWWWWGISQENDDFLAEPWHLLQGAKVDCYNFTPTQPHDDGDDSHIIIMLILIPIIIVVNINTMIMMINVTIISTWSWESIQISSQQGRVTGEKSSCRIEQTLLVLKPLLENNRQLFKCKNFGVYCYCS